jgi:hypothetical protein
MTLVGGVLLGVGLLLYGQVRWADHLREEVRSTFFLWRLVGQITFMLHGMDRKTAMLIADIPEDYVKESEKISITLMILGGSMALVSPFLRSRGHGARG